MNGERQDARSDQDPGPAIRRALKRRRRGSKILQWCVVFLAVLAVGQAVIFIPILSELGRRVDPPAVRDVNLPERMIRVYRGRADGEVRLLLKAPLDLPEADGARAARLDEALFPGGARHHYFVLHAVNAGETDRVLELGPLVVEDADGRCFTTVDLREAMRSRAAEIPEYLRFHLSVQVPPEGDLGLPARSVRDVLVAFPADLAPERIALARIGELTLSREELRKDELDGFLEDPRREGE